MIRVGLIGCGWIGGVHSMALRGLIRAGLVDAQVVACTDTDPARAEAFAHAHGDGAVAVDSPAAVIDRADAVWVCTPTATHRALVEQAVAAGRAVYCEKPLATTLVEVEAMDDLLRASETPNQVGLVLRSSAPFQCLAELIASGSAGRPMAAVLRDDQFFPIQGRYASSWRAQRADAGGGTLIEHSIHDLDLLAWLLGPIEEVTCRTANFAGHDGIEDVATVTLAHRSGATSTLVSVWHQVLSRPSLRRLEVFCEDALLWLDDDNNGPVHVERSDGIEVLDTRTGAGWMDGLPVRDDWRDGLAPYAAADRAFLDALAAGRPPAPDFGVARVAHTVVDAAYRSAAGGTVPVSVALL